MHSSRMYTTFHESFSLSRPSISAILGLSIQMNGHMTLDDIKRSTSLGTNYIKAMPRYARACGLLPMKSFSATPLGQMIYKRDQGLCSPATLWLMHYHLSAPHGPGPVFWNRVVTLGFAIGQDIDAAALGQEIGGFIENKTREGPSVRTGRTAATVILGTYAKNDGLGGLGIIQETKGKGRRYRVLQPEPPPAGALAYALADYWEGIFGDRVSVNLDEITAPNGFVSLFFMGAGLLSSKLSELQREGILEVHRAAPPYQVVKLWPSKEALLRQIYG